MNWISLVVWTILMAGIALPANSQVPAPSGPKFQVPPTKKLPATSTAAKPQAQPPKSAAALPGLKTQKEKVSYSLGQNLGMNFKQQGVDIDFQLLSRGIQDALLGAKPMISEKDMSQAMETFRQQMMAKQQAQMQVLAVKNKKEGEEFLAENKSRAGVVALSSGLQYKELKAGTGATPKSTDTVTVNYRGTLLDGTEFDNSYKRREPVTFEVSKIIAGWTEALQLMKVGAKWQLFVPSSLAYGQSSPGAEIPPNSTLVFEIELLSIKP